MKKLTIYFTSDTHGYLYPTDFTSADPKPMGLLSMRFPKDGNTLVIDGGDTIQGSPLTYWGRVTGAHVPIAAALNKRGYDFVTLGNHDFNYGQDNLIRYLNELDARCLCANVKDRSGRLPVFPSAVRVMENGLRVGLVGIVTDWVNRWEKPENLEGFTVSDPLQAAREAVRDLDCDVLIGIYHGGIERDLETGRLLSDTNENIACRLCEEIPFDLLLTGHQHIALAGGKWKNTHIVQTPMNGTAYIRVEMDDEGHFTSCLSPVPAKAVLTAREKDVFTRLDAWLDHPVGHLAKPLWPRDKVTMGLEGTSIADFFNLVQLDATGADLSCTALANAVKGFNAVVTVRDVVVTYVYTNTLTVLQVTGEIVKQALEQCASYFDVDVSGHVGISEHFLRPKESHYNYDYFSGLTYTFDLGRPVGQRVVRMERNGKPIEPQDRFTLCMSNYRATGAGDFDFYRACPVVREIQTDICELILNYFGAHSLVTVPRSHPIRVILPQQEKRP